MTLPLSARVLARTDVPAGFAPDRIDDPGLEPADEDAIARCLGIQDIGAGQLDTARSNFVRENRQTGTQLASVVTRYRSPDGAAAVARLALRPSAERCFGDAIVAAVNDTDDNGSFVISDHRTTITLPQAGDPEALTATVTVDLTTHIAVPSAPREAYRVDIAFVQSHDLVGWLFAFGNDKPDTGSIHDMAARLATRVAA